MVRGSRLLVIAASIALPLSAMNAAATDHESERTKVFAEGKALADAGNYAEAAEKFKAVIKLRSAPKAWIALAVVEEKQNHLLAARDAYATAAHDASAAKLETDRAQAQTGAERVSKAIPHLVLSPPKAVTPTIEIDGKALGSSTMDVEVDPGSHTIVARAPKHREFRQTVTVAAGDRREVVVELPFLDPSSPTPGAAPPSIKESRSSGAVPVVMIVAGGLTVLVGGYVVVRGWSTCSECTATEIDDSRTWRSRVPWGWGAVTLGAVVSGVGAIWYLTSSPSSPRSTGITAMPTAGGAAFSFAASF